MSQENVEIVRGAFAEFERGNFWIPEVFDPSIRIVWLVGLIRTAAALACAGGRLITSRL
jgi:hypothetical protein